jgi:hypothetical protein
MIVSPLKIEKIEQRGKCRKKRDKQTNAEYSRYTRNILTRINLGRKGKMGRKRDIVGRSGYERGERIRRVELDRFFSRDGTLRHRAFYHGHGAFFAPKLRTWIVFLAREPRTWSGT